MQDATVIQRGIQLRVLANRALGLGCSPTERSRKLRVLANRAQQQQHAQQQPRGFAELQRRDFQGVTLAAAAVGAATGTAAAMGAAAQLGELQRATAHNAMGAAQVAAASAGVAVGGGSQLGEVI